MLFVFDKSKSTWGQFNLSIFNIPEIEAVCTYACDGQHRDKALAGQKYLIVPLV
jgi:hypothetical protein